MSSESNDRELVGGRASVAICMATYNPVIPRFRRQIESIRAQTRRDWVCIISDDASDASTLAEMRDVLAGDGRFTLHESTERLGFYRNFERSLTLAPRDVEFISLSDQDDYWRPHKLAASLARFERETLLVYCDMRIVGESGEVFSPTFWKNRRNNSTDLGSLLVMNAVPGAGAVFRRSLLDYVLPFPEKQGQLYHDHWIAVVALSLGKMAFVDEPLYDWIQHSANVIGFIEAPRRSITAAFGETCRKIADREGRKEARDVHHNHVLRIALMAGAAAQRCSGRLSWRKRHVLRRAAELGRSWRSLLWLAGRGLLDWKKVGVTNGAEYYVLLGALWGYFIVWKSRLAAYLCKER